MDMLVDKVSSPFDNCSSVPNVVRWESVVRFGKCNLIHGVLATCINYHVNNL